MPLAASAAVPLFCVITYRGQPVLLEATTARAMAAMSRSLRRSESKRRAREVTFTDLGYEPVAYDPPPPKEGTWEGPRFRFTHLLGENRAYAGDPCRGGHLQPHQYCLGCDHSGRDLEIPGPHRDTSTAREPARFRPKGRG